MQTYRILKTFPGSQTGLDSQTFSEGSVEPLSDDLAAIALSEGWVEAADESPEPADERETKVVAPDETKPKKPLARKAK